MSFGHKINPLNTINNDEQYDLCIDSVKLNKSDKWKLVSHLHKSIRHGKSDEAKLAAKWLYMLDQNYARYRVAVISFEDVAGGNLSLVNSSMRDGFKFDDIERKGGVEWFSDYVYKLSDSIKNRFANDLCFCKYFSQDYLEKFSLQSFEDQTVDDALKIAFDENENYFFRAIAAWRIVGTKKVPNSSMGKFEGDHLLWISECEKMGISDETLECMDHGFNTQKEGSCIMLPFTEIEKNKGYTILEDQKFIRMPNIDFYCSAAFDKHTKEGKTAIYNYIKNNPKLRGYARQINMSDEDLFLLVGKIQFREEGGVLNKKITFDAENEISSLLWGKFSKTLNADREIFKMIRRDRELWHLERKKIIKKSGE